MRNTPHNMAPATASQPQINSKIVVARLIWASFAPQGAHTVFSMDSLATRRLPAIDQWSWLTNFFALLRTYY